MLKNNSYLIAAIGTDLGKTFLLENICRNLREKGKEVVAIKPISSGFDDFDLASDSAKIMSSLGLDFTEDNLSKISPWRFKEAISPHFAAKKSGCEIDFKEVVNFCQKAINFRKEDQFLFIETAGGIMTPINDNKTFLDLAIELQLPILFLSANYLGSISHTLCAIETLKNHKISVEKIIINEHSLANQQSSSVDISRVVETIANFSDIETCSMKDFFNKLS